MTAGHDPAAWLNADGPADEHDTNPYGGLAPQAAGEVTAAEVKEWMLHSIDAEKMRTDWSRVARWVNARLRAEREAGRAEERARLTELWRGDSEPSSVWTLTDWEEWSNDLASLLPDIYDNDEGQEAITERALKELLAGQILGSGKTPDDHFQAGRAEGLREAADYIDDPHSLDQVMDARELRNRAYDAERAGGGS